MPSMFSCWETGPWILRVWPQWGAFSSSSSCWTKDSGTWTPFWTKSGKIIRTRRKRDKGRWIKAKLMLSLWGFCFLCKRYILIFINLAVYHPYIFRIQRPTTDGIYQVIKSNRNLIIREKNQLDDLETQLKQLKLYNRNSSWKHPDTSR